MPEYAEFSEFSYGYALVDNAINGGGWDSIVGAPHFLSLIEEGSTGGGHDITLPFQALPLFLQFKIPQVMRRGSRHQPAGFYTPYYRMHLRHEHENASGKTQHEQLLELEAKNPLCVYYVTPRFNTIDQLDAHYLAQTVPEHSEWFSPAALEPTTAQLPRGPHRVAYNHSSSNYEVQSEPMEKHEGRFRFRDVGTMLTERLKRIEPEYPETWIARLESQIFEITGRRKPAKEIEYKGVAPDLAFDEIKTGTEGRQRFPRKLAPKVKRQLRELSKIVNTRLDSHLAFAIAPSLPRPSQPVTDDE